MIKVNNKGTKTKFLDETSRFGVFIVKFELI